MQARRLAGNLCCLHTRNQAGLLSIRLAFLPSCNLSCQPDDMQSCFHAGFHGESCSKHCLEEMSDSKFALLVFAYVLSESGRFWSLVWGICRGISRSFVPVWNSPVRGLVCRIRPSPSGSQPTMEPDATGRQARRWSRLRRTHLPARLRAGGILFVFQRQGT